MVERTRFSATILPDNSLASKEEVLSKEELDRLKKSTCARCNGIIEGIEILKWRGGKLVGKFCSYKCSREEWEEACKDDKG